MVEWFSFSFFSISHIYQRSSPEGNTSSPPEREDPGKLTSDLLYHHNIFLCAQTC